MYIDIVPNRKSPPAVLLRKSKRVGAKIVKTTIANLSSCPPEAIKAFQLALKGIQMVPKEGFFHIDRSLPHGHVQAVLGMMRHLGMDQLLSSHPCLERDLVLAMIAQRILTPCSKLATSRVWHETTLAGELHVEDAGTVRCSAVDGPRACRECSDRPDGVCVAEDQLNPSALRIVPRASVQVAPRVVRSGEPAAVAEPIELWDEALEYEPGRSRVIRRTLDRYELLTQPDEFFTVLMQVIENVTGTGYCRHELPRPSGDERETAALVDDGEAIRLEVREDRGVGDRM